MKEKTPYEAERKMLDQIDRICRKSKYRKSRMGSLYGFSCKKSLRFRSRLTQSK